MQNETSKRRPSEEPGPPLSTEQAALLDFVMGIFATDINPDSAPSPDSYLMARTLSDLARLMAPAARVQCAEIPASDARDRLVALAYMAVAPLGLVVAEVVDNAGWSAQGQRTSLRIVGVPSAPAGLANLFGGA